MTTRSGKRFFVETWGCQMNELDSQRLSSQLMEQGYLPTLEAADADVILLNSCSVREKAAHKAYSRLGEYRLFKKAKPSLVIGFCGCVAQQEADIALARVPELDLVIGPGRVGELGEILRRRQPGEKIVSTGFPLATERNYHLDSLARDGAYKGMVTVIEGCDKKCTFCIVPSTRGPEQCREIEEIVSEVEHLLSLGFVEIELLGQTVNHWRDPIRDLDFADLLDRIAGLDGLRRLRFVTSYPRDFTQRMVDQFAAHKNVCPYLHLPVQSGSNRILRLMGRGYEVGEYRDLIRRIRKARTDIALSTDIIVGFPGESDQDFQETLNLVEEIGFASVYAFKYSPRPGTAAPRLRVDKVEDQLASERLQRLFATQRPIQIELNEKLVGSVMEVLVTGNGKTNDSQTGRSACHRVVNFDLHGQPPVDPGLLVSVHIGRAYPHSLYGSLIQGPVPGFSPRSYVSGRQSRGLPIATD